MSSITAVPEDLTPEGLLDIPDGKVSEYAGYGYADEVLPLPPAKRTWGTLKYVTVWMGPIHNILSYFTVVGFFALGLSAVQVVLAIMTSAVIVAAGYVLNGHAGAKYGTPFAMLVRDTFGVKGAIVPAVLRGIIAGFVFFGVSTVASAQAMNIVFERIFPGFLDIGNGGNILGLPIPTAISYAVLWVIAVAVFYGGQKFIGRFSDWTSPIVYVLVVLVVVLAVGNAGGIGNVFDFHPVTTPVTPVIFITCVSALVSNWAGPIVNVSDLTRDARTARAPRIGFPVGLIVSYLLFAAVTVALMASLQATTGSVDPSKPSTFVDAINSIGNSAVIILLILAMNVGATAFMVFGNMLPAGLQLTAQLPKLFTVRTGAFLTAVVGTLFLPWKFVENTDMLFFFYSFIGSMFGPIAGIMLASYYFERRKRLDLDCVYVRPGGTGRFSGSVNGTAMSVLLVSFVITMSGKFLTGVPFLVTINSWAFFSGLVIGFVGYLLLTRVVRRTPSTD